MSIYNVFIFIAALYGLFSYTTWGAVAILSEKPQSRHKLFIWVICICYRQCWGKLLLKVMHYNIALLPKKVTNYVT